MASTLEDGRLQLDRQGRLVIPRQLRERMQVQPGQQVSYSIQPDGSLVLRSPRRALTALQELFAPLRERGYTVEKFLEERRAEAQAEEAGLR